MAQPDSSRTIGSVERVCRIIDVLNREGEAGVSSVTECLDISKGTVSTYLSTLAQEGYVVKEGGKYQLSLRYLGLAEEVKDRIPVYDIIAEELTELAERTDERCQFAMPERGRVVVVYIAEGESAVNRSLSIGKSDYMHCLALGKAMLAHFSRERQNDIVETHGLPSFTDQTITDRETLFEELEAVRGRGYAVDDEERIPGIRCVAVPVQKGGDVFGSISVSGPATRMPDSRLENEIHGRLEQAANVIEVDSHLA